MRQKDKDVPFLVKVKSVLTLGEWYDSNPVFPILLLIILLSVVAIVLVLICWGVIKALGVVGSWETAIQVALITVIGTVALPFVSKWCDEIKVKRLMLYKKRLKAYDEISVFLFECQKRSGYQPSGETFRNIDARLMQVNRAVYLWASEEVQIYWEEYLCANQSGTGCQLAVWHILGQIGVELGTKYRDRFFSTRPFSFWYSGHGYTMCLDKNSTVI